MSFKRPYIHGHIAEKTRKGFSSYEGNVELAKTSLKAYLS